MKMIDELMQEMISYYKGDPKRIQHFLKVHSLARLIGLEEGLDENLLFTLESAALVHDIGIKEAEQKYGTCNGKLQEQEGPSLARQMLQRLHFDQSVSERVCYLVGHHHTYSGISGDDYQILVEADFLVNLYEEESPRESIISAYKKIFRTASGKNLCRTMFGL